ncbi:MAG: hypothetical protein QXY52_04210 [Conexivisphaerales archaeon]
MQEKTLIIRWGLNEDVLFNYLIALNKEVIKDGLMLSSVNEDRALKILRKIIERNKIERLIVENNAFLNNVRVAANGHDASENRQWGKKLRSIDKIYQSIISGQILVPFEIKDFYPTREKLRYNYGKFIELDINGTVKFEREKIKIPKSLMNFSAYIYESFIVQGISFIRPTDKVSSMEGGKIVLQLDDKRKIILRAELKPESKYVAVWVRKTKKGPDAIISYGKTFRQAWGQHRKAVISEMVKWVNQTKKVGFVLGLSRVSHAQAPEYVMKFIDNKSAI